MNFHKSSVDETCNITYNEEHCTNHHSLHLHIKIHRNYGDNELSTDIGIIVLMWYIQCCRTARYYIIIHIASLVSHNQALPLLQLFKFACKEGESLVYFDYVLDMVTV